VICLHSPPEHYGAGLLRDESEYLARDMHTNQRAAYLQDLRAVVNANSVWLLRDFVERHASILGRLTAIVQAKTDDQLSLLIEDIEGALNGRSDNQLAAQLCAPWLLPEIN
jgi:hypothetical protein